MSSPSRIVVRQTLLALVILCIRTDGLADAADDQLGDAVRQAVKIADASIVRLRPVGSAGAEDPSVIVTAPTTGLVVSAQGEILTSSFALQGNPQAIVVETPDGARHSAAIIATDFVRKLVLLRVAENSAAWKVPEIPPRSAARIGQWAICAGRFYAADSSNISVGIISARDRIHGLALQTDAKVSPMNYGGPLLDLQGGIHGILVPMSPRGDDASAGVEWYDSGIGFAVPLEDAMRSVARLREGHDLLPGKLGISLSAADTFSAELSVREVVRGGPAEKSGFRKGDRLLTAAGIPLARTSILESIIGSRYAGDSVTFEIQRQAEKLSLTAELIDQLPKVKSGFLGLLPLPTDSTTSADVVVLEETPAKAAGLTGVVRVIEIKSPATTEAAKISNAADLIAAVDTLVEGDSVTLTCRKLSPNQTTEGPPDAASELTVTFSSGTVPTTEQKLTNRTLLDYRNEIADAAETTQQPEDVVPEVTRQEVSLSEAGKCTVLSNSAGTQNSRPGLIVLVSASEQTEETILRQWQREIVSHRLAVAIPSNPENIRLTTEDIPLIVASVLRVVEQFKIDRTRIVLVAGPAESAIAERLAISPRSPFRGLAMESGWFSPPQGVSAGDANRRVLMLEPGRDRQTRALAQQAREAMEQAGLRVFLPSTESEQDGSLDSAARRIADWSLLIKSL